MEGDEASMLLLLYVEHLYFKMIEYDCVDLMSLLTCSTQGLKMCHPPEFFELQLSSSLIIGLG